MREYQVVVYTEHEDLFTVTAASEDEAIEQAKALEAAGEYGSSQSIRCERDGWIR